MLGFGLCPHIRFLILSRSNLDLAHPRANTSTPLYTSGPVQYTRGCRFKPVSAQKPETLPIEYILDPFIHPSVKFCAFLDFEGS